MIDEQLKILRQIQENTAPAPRQVFIAKKQEELIDEAGKVPVKLLLGIPLVFGGLLPFLFENGSDLDLSLSALLTTFFLLFFVVPVMLVVFRAHNLGFAKLAVYALGFAATAYAVDLIRASWLRVPAIVILAVVFGMGPHLLASGAIPALRRAVRRVRNKRGPAREPVTSTGITAAPADPDAQPASSGPSSEIETPAPSGGALVTRSGVFGRLNRRDPEQRSSLLFLSLASTVGILLLFMAPRSKQEAKWGLVRLDTLVSQSEYANAAEFVRDVRHADTRQKHTAKLRARDEAALQFLPLRGTFWDSAIAKRQGLMAPQPVLEAAAGVNPGSPDTLLNWLKDTTWNARLDSADAHRDNAVADSAGAADREEIALNLTRRLAAARDSFRMAMAPRLALPLDRAVVPDSAALESVRTLETVAATLRAGRAEQQAGLVAASEQLAGEQRQIFVMMNNAAQERLATTVNNARVVGIWLFAAALLIMAVGLATDPARSRKPNPEGVRPEREKPALREGDRHLRSAYVLGCSLMALFILPLLQRVDPDELDLSRPFSPFTVAPWYLPAFAEQSIQTGFGTTRIHNTTVRQGSGGSTVVIRPPRDTDSTRIVFDTTVIESAVAKAVEAGRADAEVRTSTTLDRQLLGVVGQVVETRTVLRQDISNVRTDVGSVAGSVSRVQGEVGTVNEAVRQVQQELRDTTITGGAGS